jgi:hypothetical protein
MEQRSCPVCGTGNLPAAATCDTCGTPLAAGGEPDRPAAVATASDDTQWLQPVRLIERAPEPPGPPPAEVAAPPPRPSKAPKQPKPPGQPRQLALGARGGPRRRGRWAPVLVAAAAVVVLAAAVVGGVLLAGRKGSSGTGSHAAGADGRLHSPEQVGGMQRIDDPAFAEQVNQQNQALGANGFDDFVVAGYGSSVEQPDFVLIAVRARSVAEVRRALQAVNAGLESSGAVVRDTGGTLIAHDGVQFRCSTADVRTAPTTCVWQDGDTVGVGYSTTAATRRLSELTAEARRALARSAG